jgi:hypothetical protein
MGIGHPDLVVRGGVDVTDESPTSLPAAETSPDARTFSTEAPRDCLAYRSPTRPPTPSPESLVTSPDAVASVIDARV